MSSFARSRALLKSSRQVLNMNPSLTLYPVLTAVSTLVVLVMILVPSALIADHLTGIFERISHLSETDTPTIPQYVYPILFLSALVVQWVVVMANATFFIASDAALQGEKLTIRQAFAQTWEKRGPLTLWALFSFTIGQIIRLIGEKLGIFGRITQFLGGAAWSLGTIFAIPTVVRHGTGPIQTVKDSAKLFKRSWGESLRANFSLAMYTIVLTFGSIMLCGYILGILSDSGHLTLRLGLAIGSIFLLIIITGSIYIESLSQIYKSALYRYAETGDYVGPFSKEMLESAFQKKTA